MPTLQQRLQRLLEEMGIVHTSEGQTITIHQDSGHYAVFEFLEDGTLDSWGIQ